MNKFFSRKTIVDGSLRYWNQLVPPIVHASIKTITAVYISSHIYEFTNHTQVGFIRRMFNLNIISCLIGILLVKRSAGDFRTHPNWPKHVEEICGESDSDRIIGGANASLGQFPWMVRLVYFYQSKLQLQKHMIFIFN